MNIPEELFAMSQKKGLKCIEDMRMNLIIFTGMILGIKLGTMRAFLVGRNNAKLKLFLKN